MQKQEIYHFLLLTILLLSLYNQEDVWLKIEVQWLSLISCQGL